ncbi:hypothetical protein RDI58_029575 [Solanum bulbocastanum]|uniref:Uncharacterized protein n=1 Tax=Solanum bulbocastanum TaxID=147425 RepID=A0AAN8SYH6_SOLBU
MSSIFDHPRTYIDNLVLPIDPWFPSTDSLVVAKLSFFECGGVALGVCLSHKVSDGCSLVEAITAFLYRCVNTTPSLLIQAVDHRGTSNDALVPVLPFVVSATNKEEMNLERLVSELRKGKERIQDMLKYIESEEFLCSKVLI